MSRLPYTSLAYALLQAARIDAAVFAGQSLAARAEAQQGQPRNYGGQPGKGKPATAKAHAGKPASAKPAGKPSAPRAAATGKPQAKPGGKVGRSR